MSEASEILDKSIRDNLSQIFDKYHFQLVDEKSSWWGGFRKFEAENEVLEINYEVRDSQLEVKLEDKEYEKYLKEAGLDYQTFKKACGYWEEDGSLNAPQIDKALGIVAETLPQLVEK